MFKAKLTYILGALLVSTAAPHAVAQSELVYSIGLDPSVGVQPRSTASSTISSFDDAGIQTLFGAGKLPTLSHTDRKYKRGVSRQCRNSWNNVRARKVEKRNVTPAQVEALRRKAVSMGLNEKYVRRSLASFLANQSGIPNQRHVTFIDFTQRSNQKRMVIMDLSNNSIRTFHVAAGSGSDVDGDGRATRFTNQPNTNASSVGCYVANGEFRDSKGRPAMLLHGIESTNDNACQRSVFMHTANYVGGIPGRSWGCPAVRPQDRKEIYGKVGGGGLVCAYYDGSDREPAAFKKKKSSGNKKKKRSSNGRRRR